LQEQYQVRRTDVVESAYDIVLNVPLEDFEKDPFPLYQWIRTDCPVAYAPSTGRVLVTTWDLCKEAGMNDAVFGPTKLAHETVYGCPNVLSMTGGDHLKMRSAVAAPFRPKAVQSYREEGIRKTAIRYIEAIRAQGATDVTKNLIEPMGARIVGDVLGFTDVDDETLCRWFYAFADYFADYGRDPAVAERTRQVKIELADYVARRLPIMIERQEGGLLFRLFHDGMPTGRPRALDEVLPTIGVLIVGGFQEPAHAVSNALLGLFTRPEQASRVAADPEKWVRRTLEEGLRWLAPFGMTEKLTTADVVLNGVKILAGTEIGLVIGAANRDPQRFHNPEEFDIDRANQAHMAFGFGSHFCVGHTMARTLGEIILEEMFIRLPNLRPDPDRAPVVHGWVTRAAKTLPLVWDA
jgi:cytochrome P450